MTELIQHLDASDDVSPDAIGIQHALIGILSRASQKRSLLSLRRR